MSNLTDRMIRAARLEPALYEEVEADSTAMGQAMGVVILSSAAAGIGAIAHIGISGLLFGTIAALVGWFIWAFITFFVGTKLLPEPQTSSDVGELLRTIGFASSPGVIRIVGIIPGLGMAVNMLAGLWMLVATVIAVRQALDYSTTLRAVGVCAIGWIIQMAVMMMFTMMRIVF